MQNIFYIFVGGGVGSVLRFLISNQTQKLWILKEFPLGTFLVNMLGCFLMGVFISVFARTDHYLKMLFITGFCGGFTTFSAFSAENFSMWESGNYSVLIFYVLISVFVGLLAVFLGLQVAKQ